MNEKHKESLNEEIEIFRQIRKWSKDESLDLAFREALDDFEEELVLCFEGIEGNSRDVKTVVYWTCPICERENVLTTNYFDDNWSDTCDGCKGDCSLPPPDF